MPHNALPTPNDITTLLGALQTPIVLPVGFPTQDEINAAVDEWNRRTRYRPFFQTSNNPVTILLDPPGPDQRDTVVGGSNLLQLPNGLLSLAASGLVIDYDPTTNPTSGTVLVQNKDFWLGPGIAPSQVPPEPFTEIQFGFVLRGLRQSIQITGVWGYCQTTISDEVWAAMRDLAVARVLETLIQWLVGQGFGSARELDEAESYDADFLRKMIGMLKLRATRVMNRYRLLT